MLLRVTPIIDSDIKVLLLNTDKVLGLLEYEMDDGPVTAVILGVSEAGDMESMPVREDLEDLIAQMQGEK